MKKIIIFVFIAIIMLTLSANAEEIEAELKSIEEVIKIRLKFCMSARQVIPIPLLNLIMIKHLYIPRHIPSITIAKNKTNCG